jgi:hypothetical protein
MHFLPVTAVSNLGRWLPLALLVAAGALASVSAPSSNYAMGVARTTWADRDCHESCRL